MQARISGARVCDPQQIRWPLSVSTNPAPALLPSAAAHRAAVQVQLADQLRRRSGNGQDEQESQDWIPTRSYLRKSRRTRSASLRLFQPMPFFYSFPLVFLTNISVTDISRLKLMSARPLEPE